MKLSNLSIETLKKLVSGDSELTPYKSGPDLIKLFNRYGFQDEYNWNDGGLPDSLSRNDYVVKRLTDLNETHNLINLIEDIVDSRNFIEYPNLNNDTVAEKINQIIINDGYYLKKINGIWQINGNHLSHQGKVESHFEEIQSQILNEINIAKYIIWIAVAWFTDQILFQALQSKKQRGINIQIIVVEDDINRKHGFEFEKFFETYRISQERLMHHKFCVIDLETVISGSYNWTKRAQYNNEDITINRNNREIAEKFANQFIKLKIKK